jgi:hypothetical protein
MHDILYPTIFLLFFAVSVGAEVFSSTSDLKLLYNREASLIKRVTGYIKGERERLSRLSE